MSKKYRVRWCETVEYCTYISAPDEDQALDTFQGLSRPERREGVEDVTFDVDSIRIEEA